MLLGLGLAMRPEGLHARWRPVALVALYKLVGMPLAMLLACRALGVPAGFTQVAVMEAAMPVMFYALVLAQAGGLAQALMADLVMASTLASALTLPLWAWWLAG
jgi:predicted permease